MGEKLGGKLCIGGSCLLRWRRAVALGMFTEFALNKPHPPKPTLPPGATHPPYFLPLSRGGGKMLFLLMILLLSSNPVSLSVSVSV